MEVKFMKGGLTGYGVMAWVSKDGSQCHEFTSCQSYLSDMVRYVRLGSWVGYEAFKYNIEDNPLIDLSTFRLCIALADPSRACAAINLFEKESHIRRKTTAESTQRPSYWVFTGSRDWLSSPFTISLFNQLVRMSTCKDLDFSSKEKFEESKQKYITGYHHNSAWSYFKQVYPYIWDILPNRKEISFNKWGNFKTHDYGTFHGYGIVSLCSAFVVEPGLKKFIKEKIRRES